LKTAEQRTLALRAQACRTRLAGHALQVALHAFLYCALKRLVLTDAHGVVVHNLLLLEGVGIGNLDQSRAAAINHPTVVRECQLRSSLHLLEIIGIAHAIELVDPQDLLRLLLLDLGIAIGDLLVGLANLLLDIRSVTLANL
jgi:hypothetical protein